MNGQHYMTTTEQVDGSERFLKRITLMAHGICLALTGTGEWSLQAPSNCAIRLTAERYANIKHGSDVPHILHATAALKLVHIYLNRL